VTTLLWLQATCCGGESTSLLNADQPDVLTGLDLLGARLLGHSCFESDCEARPLAETLEEAASGALPLDLLVVEGAVPRSPPVHGGGRDRTLGEWIQLIAPRARFAVAVGTCASFGGVMVHGRNRAGVTGLQFLGPRRGGLLGEEYRSADGLPVINVPGCPAHPDWMFGTFLALLRGRIGPADLDRFNRYEVFYAHLAHHGCPRNEFYEFKSSADAYSQQGCLFENLGCKGTQCESDCNERLWLGRSGSCPRGGFPCLSCTSPAFPDGFSPFFETNKIGGIPTSLPRDVPKAWYVAISGLSKRACPERLRRNAVSFERVCSDAEPSEPGGAGEDNDN
jgi:uptake hydrogenase small subunit